LRKRLKHLALHDRVAPDPDPDPALLPSHVSELSSLSNLSGLRNIFGTVASFLLRI